MRRALLVLVLAAALLAPTAPPAGADHHLGEPRAVGLLDSTRTVAPSWRPHVFTADATGTLTVELDWDVPSADLHLRLEDDAGAWIDSATTSARPEMLTADVEEGRSYRFGTWSVAGVATFELRYAITPGADPASGTFTGGVDAAGVADPPSRDHEVVMPADGYLVAKLSWQRAEADLDVVATIDGRVVDQARSPDASTEHLRFRADADDHVALEVSSKLDRSGYTLAWAIDTLPPVDGTFLDTVGTAGNTPSWRRHTLTAPRTGRLHADLGWLGQADLATRVTRRDGTYLVGATTPGVEPQRLESWVVAGEPLRVDVWALEGTASYELRWRVSTDGRPDNVQGPNVLIISTDDQRADSLPHLPHVQALLVEEGVVFPEAYVTTPACCPSRASMFTGQYVHNHGQLDQDSPTVDQSVFFQHAFRAGGWFTAHVGKYLHYQEVTQPKPDGWDRWVHYRGGYVDVWTRFDDEVRRADAYSTTMIGDEVLTILDDFDRDEDARPWLLSVAPTAPHEPFVPEDRFADAAVPPGPDTPNMFEQDRSDKPAWVRYRTVTEDDVRPEREAQQRMLMSVDDQVRRIVRKLEVLDELEDTLIVFTSDNGLGWGEHGRDGKFLPYDFALDVPLVLRWDAGGVPRGAVDDRLANNVDVAATVLAAAGLTSLTTLDGHDLLDDTHVRTNSFAEYWHDPANNNGIPTWAVVRTPTEWFARYYDEDGLVVEEEFYDLVADPWLLDNVLGDPTTANDPPLGELRTMLEGYRGCAAATCP